MTTLNHEDWHDITRMTRLGLQLDRLRGGLCRVAVRRRSGKRETSGLGGARSRTFYAEYVATQREKSVMRPRTGPNYRTI